MRVHPTVTASTMIAQIRWWHKVRCHNRGVEKWKARRLRPRKWA